MKAKVKDCYCASPAHLELYKERERERLWIFVSALYKDRIRQCYALENRLEKKFKLL